MEFTMHITHIDINNYEICEEECTVINVNFNEI